VLSRRVGRRGLHVLVLVALVGLLAAWLPAGADRVPFRMDASNQAGRWKPMDPSWLPAGADQVPFRMDGSNQAGRWKPMDEFGGSVYVAYNAWGGSNMGGSTDRHTVYVARRNASGVWVRGYLPAAGGRPAVFPDDIGHKQPTIAIDGHGFIHVFASMHDTNWRYYRSSRPGDPTTMVDRSSEMPDQGGRFTYPNGIRARNGDVYLIIRDLAVGRFYRWDNSANIWSRVATFASQTNYVVYPDDLLPDAAGNLHIAWEWAYGGASGLRHLGSHMRYEPATGRFVDAAGRQLTTPVGTTSTAVYQPLEPGERATDQGGENNPPGFQSAKLAIDPGTGRPVAAYRMRLTAGGRFQIRVAEWDGTAWRRQTVYAGSYTTYAAIDVTIRGSRPRVYYAKSGVPNGNQAFAAVRQPDGRWVEDPPLLPGVRVERLAADQRGTADWVFLSAPTERKLYLRRVAVS
jgi:BNR repeat-containing family member